MPFIQALVEGVNRGTVVPERKFGKIQFFMFYGLDGYFWTLITTSNTKNLNLNSKTSFF